MLRAPPSEQVTPPTTVKPSPKPYVLPRVKIHYPPATPVTQRKPLVNLNGRVVTPASAAVKRKLFTVGTPVKRSRAVRSTPPSFHISGNKERTQPVEQKRGRGVDGVLLARWKMGMIEAVGNLRVIRGGGKEGGKMVERSLVLEVVRREWGMTVARVWGEEIEVGVVANEVESGEGILIVPEPWSVVRVEGVVASGLIIVACRLGVLNDLEGVLEKTVLNVGLGRWLRRGDVVGSQYEFPETQEEDETGLSDGFKAKFADISVHSTNATVRVFVELCLRNFRISIVKDCVGELALFRGVLDESKDGEDGQAVDIEIEQERLSVAAILNILNSVTSASNVIQRLVALGGSKTLLVVAPFAAH